MLYSFKVLWKGYSYRNIVGFYKEPLKILAGWTTRDLDLDLFSIIGVGGGRFALQKNNQEPNQIMGSSSVADGGIFIYIYNYCALEGSGISCSRKRIEC